MGKKFTLKDLFNSIWFFLDDNRKQFLFWNITIFFIYFFKLVPPLFVGLIVDFFISYEGGSLTKFYTYCAVIGGLYVVVSLIRLTAKRRLAGIGIYMRYKAKVLGFDRLLNFSLKWHDDENAGNKIQRISTGATSLKEWNHMAYSDIFPIITTFIGVLVIFLFLDYIFLLFFLVYMILFFSIEFYFNRKIAYLTDQKNKASEHSTGTYFEGASNILSIKTLGAKGSFTDNIEEAEGLAKEYYLKIRDTKTRKWYFFQSLNGIFLGLFLLLIGQAVLAERLTVGFIFVYYTYFVKLREGAEDVTFLIDKVIEYFSAIKRMMPIFLDEVDEYFGKEDFPKKWKKIEFNNVGFSYDDGFKIRSFSIDIAKGKKIGIVGVSGSGKSTLMKLLLGLYKIEKGNITIGNKDYYSISHNEITKNISTVLQETELFNMSLKENITLMKKVPKHIFKTAIEVAQLDEIIGRLPEGLDTLIGEKGYRLSGGERQRVGIARAIVKSAQILILDEATASLDSATESKIQKGLEENLESTMIIVAHRLSTLKNVDEIVVFEKGKIIETGTFNSLVRKKGRFAELWNLQNKKS